MAYLGLTHSCLVDLNVLTWFNLEVLKIFYADVADNIVVSCCWLRLKFDIKVNVEVGVGLCHSVGVDWETKVKTCNISTTKEYT